LLTTTNPWRETILLLDGEALVRMPIAQYLRECGYRVLEAASVDEAMTILQMRDIQADVVLSDIELPGSMNGFAFAQWVRSVRPGLEVVLAANPERATHAAAELCDEGPTPVFGGTADAAANRQSTASIFRTDESAAPCYRTPQRRRHSLNR
jgi:CheY-like chemotaxis protein